MKGNAKTDSCLVAYGCDFWETGSKTRAFWEIPGKQSN